MSVRHFSPLRIYRIFRFLTTVFLLIKNKRRILLLPPLSPKKLEKTINELGVSFIKLSQVLATRSDFFPEPYLHRLQKVHDAVPAMGKKEFQTAFDNAFASDPFEDFDFTPIASASIGQVHKASYKGETVAVKLKRLGIKKRIKADMFLLHLFLRLFQPLFSEKTKNSIETVITEYSKMLFEEVSFYQEVRNLKKFSYVYAHCGVTFPTPVEELCNDDVIVMDYLEGFSFDDKAAIMRSGIDIDAVIEKLVHFYVEQMLINGYFHADPHPGNLRIGAGGELILLDFGMVKNIDNATRLALVEMVKAANEKDFDLYISACKRLGVVSYDANQSEMIAFTEKMFEIFEDDTLDAKSMQTLATEVLETTHSMPFKLPQDAIYVLRVSAIIEGLGTTYIENFNGVKDILPILKRNLTKALGGERFTQLFKEEISDLPLTIKHIKNIINKASEGSLEVTLETNQLESIQQRSGNAQKRYALCFALMFLGVYLHLQELPLLSATAFGAGFLGVVFKR